MNQESQRISIRKLKNDIRDAVQRADGEPRASMLDLRNLFEKIIIDVYRRSVGHLPRARGEDPAIAKMLSKLDEAKVLPKDIVECVRTACDNLNRAAHPRPVLPAGSDVILPLKNLLYVLKWYEREYQTTVGGESANLPEEIARTDDEKGPYAGTTVILARTESGSDIEEERHVIRKYLVNYGVTVVSDRGLSDDSEFRNAFFIQLFSALDQLDRAKTQLEECGLEYGSGRIFQWRKTLPNPRIDSEILKSLPEEDRRFCDGENVRTGSFEEFKLQVRNEFDKLNASPERPYLYLTFDRSNETDDSYATRLNEVAREVADVKLIPAKNARGDFIRTLKKATGFVFLYGDTESSFIEEWMGCYTESKRGMKAHLKLAALYQAPPQNQEMRNVEPRIGLRTGEWRKYGSRDQFVLGDIEAYCAELRRASD
jgi:hypothetical protein